MSGSDSENGHSGWADASTVAYSVPSGYGTSNVTISDFMNCSKCSICGVGPEFQAAMAIEMEFIQTGHCFILKDGLY